MFKKKCCECNCYKENRYRDNEIEITACDYSTDGWMADNKIRIQRMNTNPLTKLLAVRICNAVLKEAGIDFQLSDLHFSRR